MSERNESSVCFFDWLPSTRLADFHMLPQDYYPVIHKLTEYWKVERTLFPENKIWPILLIFKEFHKFWWRRIRNDNIHWFMAIRDSVDFITSEWKDLEFVHEWYFQWSWIADFDKHLAESYYGLSTEAIEEYYKDSMDTCWVDLKIAELEKVIEGFSNLKTRNDIRKYDREVAINPRNKLWLENIRKILKQNKDKKWNNAKNIVPIFAWWDHVNDLIMQARKKWFQWVITFESNRYAEMVRKLDNPK